MTSANPGRPVSGSNAPRPTALTARISLTALETNLRAVVASTPRAVIDLRADAWGHGLRTVARAAEAAGAAALLVDPMDPPALHGVVATSLLTLTGPASAPEAVYGLSDGFAPVMSLSGAVLSLKPLRAGEGVSYGYTHRAARDTTIALVTGGYAQGIVRSLGNIATVRIAGGRAPIVGRVAMDVCVVDIGAAPVGVGDEVIFFGDPARGEPALREWTNATGLTGGELVAAVGLRTTREDEA